MQDLYRPFIARTSVLDWFRVGRFIMMIRCPASAAEKEPNEGDDRGTKSDTTNGASYDRPYICSSR